VSLKKTFNTILGTSSIPGVVAQPDRQKNTNSRSMLEWQADRAERFIREKISQIDLFVTTCSEKGQIP